MSPKVADRLNPPYTQMASVLGWYTAEWAMRAGKIAPSVVTLFQLMAGILWPQFTP
jgi:hypothetical protein